MYTMAIALLVLATVPSVGATAQTTERDERPGWFSRLVEHITDSRLEEREAAVEEREAGVQEIQARLEEREAAVQKREEAVRQHEETNRRRTRVLQTQSNDLEEQADRHQAALNDAEDRHQAAMQDAEDQHQVELQDLTEQHRDALQDMQATAERSADMAWAAVVFAVGVGAWSVWRVQPSAIAELNQRRRAAEQHLVSMQGERDEAQAQLRKRVRALAAEKRKNTLLRKAVDGAESKCQEAEAAVEEAKEINTGLRNALDGIETRRRERDATIIRLRVDLDNAGKARDDAERKRGQALAAVSRLNATVSRLQAELEEAKREAAGRATKEGTARQFLGVPVGASRDDVKAAFKRVAFTVHPDRNPGPEAKRLMQLANNALAWLGAA